MRGSARVIHWHPCLFDRVAETKVDRHYFYQGVWGMEKIFRRLPDAHIDIGSDVKFVGMLSRLTKVVFVDIRPFRPGLDNFYAVEASLLHLPFAGNSVASVSCLSVAEHIGLGRYGDPIDPEGPCKASRELARILAPGGNLYFSTPIGRPRVCFNAHRIFSFMEIINLFDDLDLVDLSVVDDNGKFLRGVDPNGFYSQIYANGLFHFTK
ncbi:MAG: DUF268 domain-containing protein [Desulfobacterales bacterium]|nr:DUF268 domain-containing protein [Desulfobacterales bacterium]